MVQQEVYCDMATEDLYLRKITNVDESDNYNEAIHTRTSEDIVVNTSVNQVGFHYWLNKNDYNEPTCSGDSVCDIFDDNKRYHCE